MNSEITVLSVMKFKKLPWCICRKKSSELTKQYRQKQEIFVRNICGYISEMTDTYAINEYRLIENSYKYDLCPEI